MDTPQPSTTEDMEKEKCEYCNGDGYTAEHDPADPHIDGICCNCPIQVQCELCEGTGYKLNSPNTINTK